MGLQKPRLVRQAACDDPALEILNSKSNFIGLLPTIPSDHDRSSQLDDDDLDLEERNIKNNSGERENV